MAGSANPFLVPLGATQAPADGPGRVVKGIAPGAMAKPDWKAVPERTMRGFALQAFGSSTRPASAGGEDNKLGELRQALHKSEEARRHAAEAAKDEMVQMAKAALAEGMEKGRVEGEKAALDLYQKQLAVLARNTEAALFQLSREKAEAFLGFERLCVDLMSACMRRVLGGLPEWHAEVVLPMLRESVAALGSNASLTVRVHPADFALAKEKRTLWESLDAAVADIRFESDARIPKGGCLVESGATSASADPESLAERMAEALRLVHQSRLDALRRDDAEAPHA